MGTFVTDDAEIYPFEGWPDEQVYYGPRGAQKLYSAWWEFFDVTHAEIRELIEDGDRVLILAIQTGVQQGVTVEQHIGSIVQFRGEQAERIDYYLDWDKARAAF